MRERRKESKLRRREVKKALLGNLVLEDNRHLAPGGDMRITLWGTPDGAAGTLFLGIHRKSCIIGATIKNEKKAIRLAEESMKSLGRMLSFESVTDGAAVLMRHVFFRPVVLIFEKADDSTLMLNAYCGRGILTFFSVMRSIRLFERASDGNLSCMPKEDIRSKGKKPPQKSKAPNTKQKSKKSKAKTQKEKSDA